MKTEYFGLLNTYTIGIDHWPECKVCERPVKRMQIRDVGMEHDIVRLEVTCFCHRHVDSRIFLNMEKYLSSEFSKFAFDGKGEKIAHRFLFASAMAEDKAIKETKRTPLETLRKSLDLEPWEPLPWERFSEIKINSGNKE